MVRAGEGGISAVHRVWAEYLFTPSKNYPMVSLPLCLKKVKGMCDGGQPKFPAIPDLRVSGNRDVFEELS